MISSNSFLPISKWFLSQHRVRYLWHACYFSINPQKKGNTINIETPSIIRYNILTTQPIIDH